MNLFRLLLLLPLLVLFGCAGTSPVAGVVPEDEAQLALARKPAEVDRTGNTPKALLSYYQSLGFFTPNELLQEKKHLQQYDSSPDIRLRMAMVLGHPMQPNAELKRAVAILNELLKARDPVSFQLYPVVQMMADSYKDRLRLEQQAAKQNAQLEKQYMRLLEVQRLASELQEALQGLANIERSLPRTRGR